MVSKAVKTLARVLGAGAAAGLAAGCVTPHSHYSEVTYDMLRTNYESLFVYAQGVFPARDQPNRVSAEKIYWAAETIVWARRGYADRKTVFLIGLRNVEDEIAEVVREIAGDDNYVTWRELKKAGERLPKKKRPGNY